jgi:hypothetical protein
MCGRPLKWRKSVLIENPKDRRWQMYRKFQGGKDFAYIRHLDTTMPESYDLTTDEYQPSSRSPMVTQDMRSKLSKLTTLKAGAPSGGGGGSMRKDMKWR